MRKALADSDPQLRRAAIRVSETLVKAGEVALVADIKAMAEDSHPDVVTQALMTAKLLKFPDYRELITETLSKKQEPRRAGLWQTNAFRGQQGSSQVKPDPAYPVQGGAKPFTTHFVLPAMVPTVKE